MIFQETHNADLVREMGSDLRLWNYLADDYSPPRHLWRPNLTNTTCCILVKDTEVLGVVVFIQQSHIVWELHPMLKPQTYWSGKAKEAVLGAIDWMWEHHPRCCRIVGYVPVLKHRSKLRFPMSIGMTQYGLNPSAYKKGGKMLDLAEFGMTRPGIV
jgi:hypothetical protein